LLRVFEVKLLLLELKVLTLELLLY
jgi:hypothetical protein